MLEINNSIRIPETLEIKKSEDTMIQVGVAFIPVFKIAAPFFKLVKCTLSFFKVVNCVSSTQGYKQLPLHTYLYTVTNTVLIKLFCTRACKKSCNFPISLEKTQEIIQYYDLIEFFYL